MFASFWLRALIAIAFFLFGLNLIRWGMMLNPPIDRNNLVWQLCSAWVELEWLIGRGLLYLAEASAACVLLYGMVRAVGWVCSQWSEKAIPKDEALRLSGGGLNTARVEGAEVIAPVVPDTPTAAPTPMPKPTPARPLGPSNYSQELKQKAINQLIGRSKS